MKKIYTFGSENKPSKPKNGIWAPKSLKYEIHHETKPFGVSQADWAKKPSRQ
jgi:hypothetical protein